MTEIINENGEVKCEKCDNKGKEPFLILYRVCASCQGTKIYWIDKLMNKQKYGLNDESVQIGLNPFSSYDQNNHYICGKTRKEVDVKQENIISLHSMVRELFLGSIRIPPLQFDRRKQDTLEIDLGEYEIIIRRKDKYDRSRW